MSDRFAPLEDEVVVALRGGLRALPVPAPSPDFDARILKAVERPDSTVIRFLAAVRAVALSGISTALLCLVALRFVGGSALETGTPRSTPTAVVESAAHLGAHLDAGPELDNPMAYRGLLGWWVREAPAALPPEGKPSEPAAIAPWGIPGACSLRRFA
ncbi:MAG: hypothetical protein FJX72_22035 [Armatimonadetes bacterium]|nr:hypothetical protein [Armatimonadota bacterium]